MMITRGSPALWIGLGMLKQAGLLALRLFLPRRRVLPRRSRKLPWRIQ